MSMPLDLALHTLFVRIAGDHQAVWKMLIPLQVVSIHNVCGSEVSKINVWAPDFALYTAVVREIYKTAFTKTLWYFS